MAALDTLITNGTLLSDLVIVGYTQQQFIEALPRLKLLEVPVPLATLKTVGYLILDLIGAGYLLSDFTDQGTFIEQEILAALDTLITNGTLLSDLVKVEYTQQQFIEALPRLKLLADPVPLATLKTVGYSALVLITENFNAIDLKLVYSEVEIKDALVEIKFYELSTVEELRAAGFTDDELIQAGF